MRFAIAAREDVGQVINIHARKVTQVFRSFFSSLPSITLIQFMTFALEVHRRRRKKRRAGLVGLRGDEKVL